VAGKRNWFHVVGVQLICVSVVQSCARSTDQVPVVRVRAAAFTRRAVLRAAHDARRALDRRGYGD
jgi:hypothetical protein